MSTTHCWLRNHRDLIPNNSALIGGRAYVQGLNLVTQSFTNAAALLFW